ncbi:tellurite resistance TerB family protein [Pleurocapsa sp. FMAR1]|uniref:tellurite resistance TerB family protein n=1 Tax=Pleurocapsa sp. FMAR1 TaxID=3040204 RepID=UPI0029C7B3CC|nr:tellurite resistance TerB family protein [Pleurocapsa sp. FMAR1]
MSLFDNFSNVRTGKTTDLSPAESFAGIMLATIAADGYLAREETQSLMSTLYRMKLFQSYPNDHVSRMIDKLAKIIQTRGADTLLNVAVQCLPEYLHETVFAVATDLILSDGEVSEEEEHILQKLCGYLSISKDQINKIIEVTIIKNKG